MSCVPFCGPPIPRPGPPLVQPAPLLGLWAVSLLCYTGSRMIVILAYTSCAPDQFFPLGINSRRGSITTRDAVHYNLMPVAELSSQTVEAIKPPPAVEGRTVSLVSAVRARCPSVVGCCSGRPPGALVPAAPRESAAPGTDSGSLTWAARLSALGTGLVWRGSDGGLGHPKETA